MKTYVFKLSGGSGWVAFYAAEAGNQSEAAQKVSARIGGHTFSVGLERTFTYPSIRQAGYHHNNIVVVE